MPKNWTTQNRQQKFNEEGTAWKRHGTKYSRMDQVKFVEDSLSKTWRDMDCVSRSYPFKFFKGCLPKVLLATFLNTLSHISRYKLNFKMKLYSSLSSKYRRVARNFLEGGSKSLKMLVTTIVSRWRKFWVPEWLIW